MNAFPNTHAHPSNSFTRSPFPGLAIKSLPPFVGHAKDIRFTNIVVSNVTIGVAINFFQQGGAVGAASSSVSSVSSVTSSSSVQASASSVWVENVTGTVANSAGHIDCLGNQSCQGFR